MTLPGPSTAVLLLAFAATAATAGSAAEETDADSGGAAAAREPVATAADESAAPPAKPAVGSRRWEGAIGLLGSWGASHHGGGRPDLGVEPGFFLRWGRLTVSNSGAFATRRADDVLRGLGLDLTRRERLRVTLSLRYDRGRDDDEEALRGLGEVRKTVRARLGATWNLDEGWRVSGGWSPDILGRGGGSFVDVGLSRERALTPSTRWNAGVRLAAADSRYMRSYYGINGEQAAATGYPVYDAGAGLRDLQFSVGLRHELSARWTALAGISLGRLLGPAADGPAVTDLVAWSVGAGVGWRF